MSERLILASRASNGDGYAELSGWLEWGGGDTILEVQALDWNSNTVLVERDVSGTPTSVSGSSFTADGSTTLSGLPAGRYRVRGTPGGAKGVTATFKRVL